MNLLSHLYLSGNNTELMIGNFIADHINGNKFSHFKENIQKGIILHRQIDTYTDAHEIVRKSKRRLHERYGHYDGVIIDIFFDHFLAKNWATYSAIPLDIYVNSVYKLLEKNNSRLPEKTQNLLPSMVKYNWLYNYQFINGIQEVLNGINRRTKGKSQMNLASEDLAIHYHLFEEDFTLFFQELRDFCNIQIVKIQE
ncbi:acyl carrier protein phosphodiesterase [Tenacibaculum dicentrarchi]|nr:acyl carrier protein phosphodiesterase [Tenacibaculum dicentrarchi]MCD8407508.1 acyl carrier protein phosphodiesterase [Tenacibaculum dicentrarchi]MCD8414740.1 acyl carrier protein phosphodiesterase [Tenacibaculum dicentrarchi]MCD8419741.1 acyl carrier protein phosphodiesterase [Tenacibaculum dicentrarchi]MCD8424882.1 acyl carrier protein phosphodiesterase [Tenacibaculum dicentrarchi]